MLSNQCLYYLSARDKKMRVNIISNFRPGVVPSAASSSNDCRSAAVKSCAKPWNSETVNFPRARRGRSCSCSTYYSTTHPVTKSPLLPSSSSFGPSDRNCSRVVTSRRDFPEKVQYYRTPSVLFLVPFPYSCRRHPVRRLRPKGVELLEAVNGLSSAATQDAENACEAFPPRRKSVLTGWNAFSGRNPAIGPANRSAHQNYPLLPSPWLAQFPHPWHFRNHVAERSVLGNRSGIDGLQAKDGESLHDSAFNKIGSSTLAATLVLSSSRSALPRGAFSAGSEWDPWVPTLGIAHRHWKSYIISIMADRRDATTDTRYLYAVVGCNSALITYCSDIP